MKTFKAYWYNQFETKHIDYVEANSKEEAESKVRIKYYGTNEPGPLLSIEESSVKLNGRG
jgi:hypothetical protein